MILVDGEEDNSRSLLCKTRYNVLSVTLFLDKFLCREFLELDIIIQDVGLQKLINAYLKH